jgi:hypothetical protein
MRLGVKSFFKELDKKKKLIDEFKQDILEKGEGGMEDMIEALMSVGNKAYRSGDSLVLRYFLGTLLELEEEKTNMADYQKFPEIIHSYGLRAIRDTDHYAFAAVVGAFSDSVCGIQEIDPINRRVESLRDLAMKAASEGLGDFSLEVIRSLGALDKYFEDEGLGVSRISLRNAVINIVHSLPEGRLKEKVTVKAEKVLSRGERQNFEVTGEEAVVPI